jgi:cupin superfamily acireductone dioxygenase involved in methionine salvage
MNQQYIENINKRTDIFWEAINISLNIDLSTEEEKEIIINYLVSHIDEFLKKYGFIEENIEQILSSDDESDRDENWKDPIPDTVMMDEDYGI